jgi:hypothetical protein
MTVARRAGIALAARVAAVGAVAAALPATALGQARALTDRVPPGGLSSAWPLGAIVLLVAAMTLVGAWVAHRRGGAGPGRPPRG